MSKDPQTVTVYEGIDPDTMEPMWGILILSQGTPLLEEILADHLADATVVRTVDVESHLAAMEVFKEESIKRRMAEETVQ